MRARRLAGWVSSGALLALGVALLAVAGAAPSGACAGADVRSGQTGTWTIHAGPRFEAGGERITALAVDGADPSRQYVSNGTELKGSRDGGCSWQTLFTLPSQPALPSPLTRGNAAIREVAARGGRVVMTATGPRTADPQSGDGQGLPPDGVTVVYASRDGGGSFRSTTPMSNAGAGPGPLTIARSNPDVVYIATGDQMRRSDDGGATFRALGTTIEADPPANAVGGIAAIAVDPRTAEVLVVRGETSSWRSSDGGKSFTRYQAPDFDDTNSGPSFGSGGRVVFGVGFHDNAGRPHRAASAWLISDDGGERFKKARPSQFGVVQGEQLSLLAGGAPRDLMVVAGDKEAATTGGVYRWHPGVNRLTPVDEFSLSPLRSAQFEDGAEPRAYFVRDGKQLVVWRSPDGGLDELPLPPPPPEPPPPPPTSTKTKEPPQPEDVPVGPAVTLAPAAGEVQVPYGGSTFVEYAMNIPKRPSRLDAFFLMDSSNSTEPYIQRVGGNLDSLANALVKRGVDGWFGLGEYQDNGENTGTRYRRRSDLRPPGEFLKKQFRAIETEGGAEPGYTALEQVATGSGLSGSPPVPPGMQANWRRGTIRMIVHAADEAFSADPAGPDKAETMAALKTRDIHFVGLLVAAAPIPAGQGVTQCEPVEDVPMENPQTPVVAQPATTLYLLCQMQELARETDTLAPEGGVDCDGDGNQDLREGDPMVCVVTDGTVVSLAQIEDAVERLILSYPMAVEAVLEPVGKPEVGVQIKAKDDVTDIDPRVGAEAVFTVRFSCTEAQAGKAFDVPLRASLGGLPVADARPRVVCGSPPVPAAAAPKPQQAPDDPAPAAAGPEKATVVAPAPPSAPGAPVAAIASAPPPPPAFIEAPAISLTTAPAPAPAPAPGSASATAPVTSGAGAAGQVLAPAEEHRTEPTFQTVRVEDGGEAADLNFARADDPYAPGHEHWLLRTAGFAAVLGAAAGTVRRRRRTTIQSTRKAHHR